MINPELPADGGGAPGEKVGSSLRFRVVVGLIGSVLLVAALAAWLWPRPTPLPPLPDEDEDFERLLAVVNPGYAGIETCAECHNKRVAAVKTTRHYLACTPATGVKSPGFEAGRGRCDTRFPGVHFEMSRSGDKFLATRVQSTTGGEKRDTYPIGLVYGSAGKRDEMYFSWQDNRLLRIPVGWLYPFERWGADVDTMRVLDTHPSCLDCHNTWIEHIPGTPIRYRRDNMLLGVTCERCHGPGREHVEYHRKHPQEQTAQAILHPGTLSRERLMDVCAQCHGNTRLLGKPFIFRPGQPLETAYRTVKARHREDDTTTNQVQYLQESKCYQKSKMTCITCHNPHSPRSAEGGCRKCHTDASCTDQPNQPEAVRHDCVGCHMPQHIWMNSHFYTTSDDHYLPVAPRSEHRIGIYPWGKMSVMLTWLRKQTDAKSRAEAERLADQLTEFWLKEAEERQRAGRLKGAIGAFREALQITPSPAARERMKAVIARQTELDDLFARLDHADRRNPETIQVLTKILQLKPDDARAHNELGTIYSVTGRRAEAIAHLQAVARCDPTDSSGLTRLAWMAHIEGRPEEAVIFCARAEKINPGEPMNHFIWGMALGKQKQWADAEKHLRLTLRRSPTHVGANQALSEALRHLGQAEEAVRFARRAVRLSESNDTDVLLALVEAYLAAKHLPAARRTLEQALAVAERNNHPQTETIRKRLREMR